MAHRRDPVLSARRLAEGPPVSSTGILILAGVQCKGEPRWKRSLSGGGGLGQIAIAERCNQIVVLLQNAQRIRPSLFESRQGRRVERCGIDLLDPTGEEIGR